MKRIRCIFLLLVAAFTVFDLGAVRAFAQRTTASMGGSIVDSSEAAVPGANVQVRSLETGVERSVKTNDHGLYVIPALPAGSYSISISKAGFQTLTVPQMVLTVDQNATQPHSQSRRRLRICKRGG
jgi:hypothetical protein